MAKISKIVIALISLVTAIGIVYWNGTTKAVNRFSELFNAHQSETELFGRETQNDPCWFQKPDQAVSGNVRAWLQRRDREDMGYSEALSLSAAIAVFNQESNCFSRNSSFQPLSEEEVIAVLFAGPDPGQDGGKLRDTFRAIMEDRMLPKGSLIAEISGGCVVTNAELPVRCADGQRVVLFLGLDQRPRSSPALDSNQVIIIRKLFRRVEERREP